jgi:hexosaminidase
VTVDIRRATLDDGLVRKSPGSHLSLILVCLGLVSTLHAAPADTRPPLIPQPREFTARQNVSLAAGVRVLVPGADAEDRFTADDLRAELKTRGVKLRESTTAVRIYLLRDDTPLALRILRRENLGFDEPMQPEGCVLFTGEHEVFVIGHTASGVFYGAQTLKQLVNAGHGEPALTGALIRDLCRRSTSRRSR